MPHARRGEVLAKLDRKFVDSLITRGSVKETKESGKNKQIKTVEIKKKTCFEMKANII